MVMHVWMFGDERLIHKRSERKKVKREGRRTVIEREKDQNATGTNRVMCESNMQCFVFFGFTLKLPMTHIYY